MDFPRPDIAWRLDGIAASSPDRAAALELLDVPGDFVASLVEALCNARNADTLRLGWEKADSEPNDHRAVMQFHVGELLFDGFFNALGGYRAQFRSGWMQGLRFNDCLVNALTTEMEKLLPAEVAVQHVNQSWSESTNALVPKDRYFASLKEAYFAKVWFCGQRLELDGSVTTLQPWLTGGKIQLDDQIKWPSVSQDEERAWLDMKGAFLGASGPYQIKSPDDRAQSLQQTGEA